MDTPYKTAYTNVYIRKNIFGVIYEHPSGFVVCYAFPGRYFIADPVMGLFLWRDGYWRRMYNNRAWGEQKEGVWNKSDSALFFLDEWYKNLPQTRKDRYFAKFIAYKLLKDQ